MKRIITLALVLSLASPVMAQPLPKKPFHDGRISYENDPDLKRLIGIQEGLVRRLADNNTDLDLLEFAYKNGDADLIRALFGVTLQDEQQLNSQLQAIRSSLLRKHPELAKMSTNRTQCGADVDKAFSVLRHRVKSMRRRSEMPTVNITSNPNPQLPWVPGEGPYFPADPGSDCAWGWFTFQMSLCTLGTVTAPPWGFFVCSWLTVCATCWGYETDLLCD